VTAAPEAREAVAALLHDIPSGGLIEEEGPGGTVSLRAFLHADAADAALALLRHRLAALPGFGLGAAPPRLHLEEVPDDAWATVWKDHFHAFPVGRRLWVVPTWERPALPVGALPIRLDPGMAFGSGLHATTQLCLGLLEAHLRPGDTVADVGTGSGILAIAAAKLGASRVRAVDHDPAAVEVARANVLQNGVGDTVTVVGGDLLDPVVVPVDVILANLTADLLLIVAPQIAARLRPAGRAILSGIADVREEEVRRALTACGLAVTGASAAEEWRALVAEPQE
jgi:ribosomal protein L11 methyltransferase